MESLPANVRDRYLALLRGGGLPDAAFELNRKYSIEEYEKTAQEPAYKRFATDYIETFMAGIEGMLVGRLHQANAALSSLNPDDTNYPRIMQRWLDLLDRTQPLIAKMKDVQASAFPFDKLELRIEGIEERNDD